MPRRPAPTPLRLHQGPTPPRNHPKFTLPSVPQQTFYPTSTPSVSVMKQEQKYFRRRGHNRTSSSSSVSSMDSDGSVSSGIAALPTVTMQLPRRPEILLPQAARLPEVMTRGPRLSNERGGSMAMPEYRVPVQRNANLRRIEEMGPWEYSRLRLSEAEIAVMIPAPKPVIANPCPVTW